MVTGGSRAGRKVSFGTAVERGSSAATGTWWKVSAGTGAGAGAVWEFSAGDFGTGVWKIKSSSGYSGMSLVASAGDLGMGVWKMISSSGYSGMSLVAIG